MYIITIPLIVRDKSIGMIYIEGKKEGLTDIMPSHFHYIKILHDQAVIAIRKKSGM